MKYETKQKKEIIDILKEQKHDCLTINDLQKQLPDVGKTTIYRCLDELVTAGNVNKYVSFRGSSATFQYVEKPCHDHFHVQCTECGKVIHFETEKMVIKDFVVDQTKTIIYGKCKKCIGEII